MTRPPRTVVMVEGTSDQRALETLAERRDRDLAAEGVAIVPIGGAQAIGNALARYGPAGLDVRLAGLCDAGEERHWRSALEHAGLGADLTRAAMETLGFFVCDADLEDELIRALGSTRVEEVLEAHGELTPFRTFQKQAASLLMPDEAQLRRFLGTLSGRKIQAPRWLVGALELDRMPRPLDGVLSFALG